jgi:hypothetical protein
MPLPPADSERERDAPSAGTDWRELDVDELRELVVCREDEIIVILYELAVRRWAEATVNRASAEADCKRLEASMMVLKTTIEKRRQWMKQDELTSANVKPLQPETNAGGKT